MGKAHIYQSVMVMPAVGWEGALPVAESSHHRHKRIKYGQRRKMENGTRNDSTVRAFEQSLNGYYGKRISQEESEPVSPMNILAGFLLYGRNPRHAPISMAVRSAEV